MPKVILFNFVQNGYGDFHHLRDVYKKLQTSTKFVAFEFIIIVEVVDKKDKSRKIELMLKQWGSKNSFVNADPDKNPELQKHLKEAVLAIDISGGVHHSKYKTYLNPHIIRKAILEQESAVGAMGLSDRCVGLLLHAQSRLTQTEVLDNLRASSDEGEIRFLSRLFKDAGITESKEFSVNHEVIPAYYNKLPDFMNFLLEASRLAQTETICIYLSGQLSEYGSAFDEEDIPLYLEGRAPDDVWNTTFSLTVNQFVKSEEYQERLKRESNIRSIQIIEPEIQLKDFDGVPTFKGNTTGVTIKIYFGFYLEDLNYQALYRQAPYTGASGDKTFELSISCLTFPVYHSSTGAIKDRSFSGILKLMEEVDELKDLPKEIKIAYQTYYKVLPFMIHNRIAKDYEPPTIDEYNKFISINRRELLAYWPHIAKAIIKHRNLYNHLEDLICSWILLADPEMKFPIQEESKETRSPLPFEEKKIAVGLYPPKPTKVVETSVPLEEGKEMKKSQGI